MKTIEVEGILYKLTEINKEVIHYIYKLVNNKNDKVYIGCTKTPAHRMANHRYDARTNKKHLLYMDMRKIGIHNFKMQIIEDVKTLEEAKEIETYLIDLFDSRNPEFGYNKVRGTNKGFKHTDKSKKLMSKSGKGKHKSIGSEFKKGHSIKRPKGIVAWNKGISSPYKLTLEQIDFIKNDDRSIRTLAKIYKVGKSTIQYHKGKLK